MLSCSSKEHNQIVYLLDDLDFYAKSKSIKNYTFWNRAVDLDIGYESGSLFLQGEDFQEEIIYMKFNKSKKIYLLDWNDTRVKALSEPGISIYHYNKLEEIFQNEGLKLTAHNIQSILGIHGVSFNVQNDSWYLERAKTIQILDDTSSVLISNTIPDCIKYSTRVAFLIDSLSNSYKQFFTPILYSNYGHLYFIQPLGNSFSITEMFFDCNCYTKYNVIEYKNFDL